MKMNCKVMEVCGNAEQMQEQIAAALGSICIAANTTPFITVAAPVPRFDSGYPKIIIIYQSGA